MVRSSSEKDCSVIARALGIGFLILAALSVVSGQSPSVAVAQTSGPRVELTLLVTDKDNQSIRKINKDDIHVFEDKVEQTVVTLEADDRPVDCILAIDASGSFHSFLGAAMEAVQLIITNRRPADEIAIERFISSDKLENFHDFTTDGNALIESLKGFKLEGGQTAVIDAVYTAVAAASEHNQSVAGRRKAVVVITDGEDRNSYYTVDKLVTLLRHRQVQVFVIGITIELDKQAGLVRRSTRETAEKLLTTIAQESGGRVFFPRDGKDLGVAAAQIVNDLRAQFRVAYVPTNSSKSGFRKTEVKLSANGEKLKAVTPPGYYAPVATAPQQQKEKTSP
jgi:Ca-activated chloride channel family protein